MTIWVLNIGNFTKSNSGNTGLDSKKNLGKSSILSSCIVRRLNISWNRKNGLVIVNGKFGVPLHHTKIYLYIVTSDFKY